MCMCNRQARGFTLVEMVVAIVIIGVGLAGVLSAFNTTVQSSADPLIHKQMLSAAEEMMEEVLLKPFFAPPSGPVPVNSLKNCDGPTPPSREAFDDISDYAGYDTTGICDIEGAAIGGLETYNLTVRIDAAASLGGLNGGKVKKVTVSVSHGGETITLIGWRTDYAS